MATDFLSEVDETQTAGFSSRALAETNFGLTEIDFLPLDEQASKNHERAIEIFNKFRY